MNRTIIDFIQTVDELFLVYNEKPIVDATQSVPLFAKLVLIAEANPADRPEIFEQIKVLPQNLF